MEIKLIKLTLMDLLLKKALKVNNEDHQVWIFKKALWNRSYKQE